MLEQQIQCPELPALCCRGNILDMCHRICLKNNYTGNNPPVRIPHNEHLYVHGETMHQQNHLLQRMNRFCLVVFHQNTFKHLPVFGKSAFIPVLDSFYIESLLQSLLCLPYPQCAHVQRVGHTNHRSHTSAFQLCTCTEQGIQIFLAWHPTIYIRYRFIHNSLGSQISLIVHQYLLHYPNNLGLRYACLGYQTAISQPLMRIHRFLFLSPIGRKQCYQALIIFFCISNLVIIYQQRTVKEPVCMIIHKVSVKKESPLLALIHKAVPCLSFVYTIGQYCHVCANMIYLGTNAVPNHAYHISSCTRHSP